MDLEIKIEGEPSDETLEQFETLFDFDQHGLWCARLLMGPVESRPWRLADELHAAQEALYRGEVGIIEKARRIIEAIRDFKMIRSPQVMAAAGILVDWLMSEAKRLGA